MDGLPEAEDPDDPEECLQIKENFNKRRDFLKSILTSTLGMQQFRRKNIIRHSNEEKNN